MAQSINLTISAVITGGTKLVVIHAVRTGRATKRNEISVIFNPKFYIAYFGNFKQGILSMKFIKKKVIFRFRLCFLTIVLKKKIKKRLFSTL